MGQTLTVTFRNPSQRCKKLQYCMSCMVFHILVVLWFAKMIHFFFWINENGVKMILLCKMLGSSVLCTVQVRYEFHIV